MFNYLLNNFASIADDCANGHGFFGLKQWYEYLPDSAFDNATSCNIKHLQLAPSADNKSDVPLIFLAVVDDLLRIAALVAVAFVIIGAIKLITSQGSPDATANAQSTIINALIGLAIAVVSVAFVGFLGSQIGGS